jgi:hypothetical protein
MLFRVWTFVACILPYPIERSVLRMEWRCEHDCFTNWQVLTGVVQWSLVFHRVCRHGNDRYNHEGQRN